MSPDAPSADAFVKASTSFDDLFNTYGMDAMKLRLTTELVVHYRGRLNGNSNCGQRDSEFVDQNFDRLP